MHRPSSVAFLPIKRCPGLGRIASQRSVSSSPSSGDNYCTTVQSQWRPAGRRTHVGHGRQHWFSSNGRTISEQGAVAYPGVPFQLVGVHTLRAALDRHGFNFRGDPFLTNVSIQLHEFTGRGHMNSIVSVAQLLLLLQYSMYT